MKHIYWYDYTDSPDMLEYNEWYEGPGFYFADEAQMLRGPYETEEKAEKAIALYCELYL